MADNFKFTKLETFDEFVTEKVNVIKNDLLGDYNENGKYIINKKVVVELLQLEKIKRSTFNNSIFCTSYLPGFGEITFELTLKRQGNNGIASIYVLEKVDKVNGYIQNTLKTQVAVYKDVLTPDFIEKSYDGFNIKKNDDQEQKELNPESLKSSLNTYIGTRKYFIDLMDNATTDEYNTMYQQYFNKRVDLLNEDGSEYANLVLNAYRGEYNKIRDYFLKNEGAVDYKALNELLDKCFEDINGLNPSYKEKEEELKKKIIPYLNILMTQAQIIMQKGKKKVVEKAKSSEKGKLTEIAKDKEQTENSKENAAPAAQSIPKMDKTPSTKEEKGDDYRDIMSFTGAVGTDEQPLNEHSLKEGFVAPNQPKEEIITEEKTNFENPEIDTTADLASGDISGEDFTDSAGLDL